MASRFTSRSTRFPEKLAATALSWSSFLAPFLPPRGHSTPRGLSPKQRLLRSATSLERCALRLDGFEMYAFVASMAAGFSFSGLDTLGGLEHWPALLVLPFAASVVVSIFSGLFATLVFCLCSLYSKTALAEGKDLRMHTFLHSTAHFRAHGFHHFTLSVFCFAVNVIFTAFAKLPHPLGALVGLGSGFMLASLTAQISQLMASARPIFAPGCDDEDAKQDGAAIIQALCRGFMTRSRASKNFQRAARLNLSTMQWATRARRRSSAKQLERSQAAPAAATLEAVEAVVAGEEQCVEEKPPPETTAQTPDASSAIGASVAGATAGDESRVRTLDERESGEDDALTARRKELEPGIATAVSGSMAKAAATERHIDVMEAMALAMKDLVEMEKRTLRASQKLSPSLPDARATAEAGAAASTHQRGDELHAMNLQQRPVVVATSRVRAAALAARSAVRDTAIVDANAAAVRARAAARMACGLARQRATATVGSGLKGKDSEGEAAAWASLLGDDLTHELIGRSHRNGGH
ncbi:hypothetical protein AB1Y20_005578 [Prymnesium parvum]|uniref:Amino acid transporter transmembrane domain-containing protein n=1 Tax=Prymnesium parvum TaxID=97485 RepID=A0AB34J6Y9_PRYPA